MDTPIKPRASKPRVERRYALVHKHKWYDRDLPGRRGEPIYAKRYVCGDETVAAIGCTIEGAYKNWLSLKIDYLNTKAVTYKTAVNRYYASP